MWQDLRFGIRTLSKSPGFAAVAILALALGLGAALAVTRVLNAILVGVSPTDPLTFAIVGSALLTAAMLGCAIPARRAMRVDPAVALRHE